MDKRCGRHGDTTRYKNGECKECVRERVARQDRSRFNTEDYRHALEARKAGAEVVT